MTGYTRRKFLGLSRRLLLGAGAAYVLSQFPACIFTEHETEVEQTLDKIQNQYGVTIPAKRNKKYTAVYKLFVLGNTENATITLAEAKEFDEVFAKIPYAGHLVQTIVVYRPDPQFPPEMKSDIQGRYIGRFWEDGLESASAGKLFNDAMMQLFIPENMVFDSAYASYDRYSSSKRYVGRTNREEFRNGVFHESGHGLEDRILFLTWGEDGYRDRIGEVKEELHSKKEPISSNVSLAYDHPDNPFLKIGISGERFADGFSRYLIAPATLSDDFAEFFHGQRAYARFFDNIHSGLRRNPQQFIQEVAENPNLLSKMLTTDYNK